MMLPRKFKIKRSTIGKLHIAMWGAVGEQEGAPLDGHGVHDLGYAEAGPCPLATIHFPQKHPKGVNIGRLQEIMSFWCS